MATGNNRKENTFKSQLPNPFIEEELPASIDESDKAKGKKDNPSTSSGKSTKDKKKKTKESKQHEKKHEGDGKTKRIIGVLSICLAVFLGIALISYLASFLVATIRNMAIRFSAKRSK